MLASRGKCALSSIAGVDGAGIVVVAYAKSVVAFHNTSASIQSAWVIIIANSISCLATNGGVAHCRGAQTSSVKIKARNGVIDALVSLVGGDIEATVSRAGVLVITVDRVNEASSVAAALWVAMVVVGAQESREHTLRRTRGSITRIVGAQVVIIANQWCSRADTSLRITTVRVAQISSEARVSSESAVCDSISDNAKV